MKKLGIFIRNTKVLYFLIICFNFSHAYSSPREDLIKAIKVGNVQDITRAFNRGADATVLDVDGTPALVLAVKNMVGLGGANVVEALIARGSDPTILDREGKPLLVLAAHGRDPHSLFKSLLRPDHGLNVNAQDSHGITPLMVLLSRINQGDQPERLQSRAEAARVLIGHSALDIDLRDARGITALMLAAQGPVWAIQGIGPLILARGARINAQDSQGSTPLHHAVKNKNIEAVIALSQVRGANLNVADRQGKTPLDWARLPMVKKPCDTGIVGLLMQAGATVPNLVDDLTQASARGDLRAVQGLIGQGVPVNSQDRAGTTALMAAAEAGQANVVNFLLGVNNQYPLRPAPSLFDSSQLDPRFCYTAVPNVLRINPRIDITLRDIRGQDAFSRATPAIKMLLKSYASKLR